MAESTEEIREGKNRQSPSQLIFSIEPLREVADQYRTSQSDGGDTDGNDSSDGND